MSERETRAEITRLHAIWALTPLCEEHTGVHTRNILWLTLWAFCTGAHGLLRQPETPRI